MNRPKIPMIMRCPIKISRTIYDAVYNILYRIYTAYKNNRRRGVLMEKVEIPPESIKRKSADDLQAILDKFKFMPDFVPSGKELFGIGNDACPVSDEIRENKKSTP
jgi:hypothetical protein